MKYSDTADSNLDGAQKMYALWVVVDVLEAKSEELGDSEYTPEVSRRLRSMASETLKPNVEKVLILTIDFGINGSS